MDINNFDSYSRFFALPNNIATYGATQEELGLTSGQPDGNPALSPMASPRVTEPQLALAVAGSDIMRLGQPSVPAFNPYDGARLNLFYTRSAVQKLNGQVINMLQKLVSSGAVEDPTMRARMDDSLKRVVGVREYANHLYEMSLGVLTRTQAKA